MSLAKILSGLASGLLFGAGLAVAGMTDPNKILNFLDVTGAWDPSLALVMGGAIPVAALGFHLAKSRKKPFFEADFTAAKDKPVETKLLVGSALFGIGWGLSGYCPGPAIASLSIPSKPLLAFLVAMGAGLMASEPAERLLRRRQPGVHDAPTRHDP